MFVDVRLRVVLATLAAFAGSASVHAEAPKAAPFAVKVVGKGKPMILIPGLACSGEVWDSTVDHFKDRYECHVLTLAGFAGQPPMNGPFLEAVSKGIVDYIRAKKLDKPVIVGHSLGGFLVYLLGETEPDLVGPLIAVDGLPCLGAMFNPNATPDTLKRQGAMMQARFEKASREDYVKNLDSFINGWLKGNSALEKVSKWGSDSDQPTVARAMGELVARDLRPDVGRIKSRVLHLAAYDKGMAASGATREMLAKRVESQLEKVPNHKLVVAEDSRHFIMYDAPDWLLKQMDEFLAAK
jgi:pimeloyl-ACP methyl ester carboxylesterase